MCINQMNVWALYPEPLTNSPAAKENGNDNEGNKCLFIMLNDKVTESSLEGGYVQYKPEIYYPEPFHGCRNPICTKYSSRGYDPQALPCAVSPYVMIE
jgi:hypothetical protein